MMFLGVRKKYWLFLAGAAALIGLMMFANFSPVFAVQETHTSGPFADKLQEEAIIASGGNVNLFRFDKKDYAGKMLAVDKIDKVRLKVRPPHGISVEVNLFEPAALVLTDDLYGLDNYCRLIPFDPDWDNIDLPVLTGLKADRMFAAPPDFRVAEVMMGLDRIRDNIPELHKQIAEIDFSDSIYVGIHLTTDTNVYLALSRNFESQLVKLDAIRSLAAGTEGRRFNLQYEDIVIKNK